MKKLFLMASMLLISVCMFAQDNNNPLKGDVNGDGTVDVADITAIIKIMKDGGGTEGITVYDYYVGWTNGTKSQFASKTNTELLNNATGYSIVSNPTYSRAFGDNNIFYLLYQTSKAPTQVILTSQGWAMVQDIVNDNICPHADVVIDGVTYKVFGIRMATGYDPTDMMTVTFETAQPQYKTVQIGHGTDYANAVFADTGRQLEAGMHLTQAVSKNDYLFLKIDKNQKIELVTTDNDNPIFNSEITFDSPVIDGEYKYYKKTDSFPRAITARILIVKI